MFFLVFVLFTSRWSVRKVLDCFLNMHLCAKLQPYRSKKNKAKQKNRYKQISHKGKIINFAIVITDG